MTITHGKMSTYNNLACRCDECRKAARDHKRADRKRRAAEIKADPSVAPHGRFTTYANWGCRCSDCTAANSATCRRNRLARLARQEG